MAFGANSAIMNVFVDTVLYPRAAMNAKLYSTTWMVALFNNSVTPDNTAVAASAGFNTGTWTQSPGNEVVDVTNWATGGRGLGTPTSPPSGGYVAQNYVMLDAADTAGGGNVTLSNVYGDFVYDSATTSPVAKLGVCYHSYGGSAQGVVAGTFCVDAATEILTARGWLTYDQVRAGDSCLALNTGTGLPEWQPIRSVHVFTGGPYDVTRMEGPSHSSVTTPDHRWPAVTPGGGITWHTTRTLPPDAQLLISESERTDKIADLAVARETTSLVWCVQTPSRTWYARRNGTSYYTGNTVLWHSNGVARWTHTPAP